MVSKALRGLVVAGVLASVGASAGLGAASAGARASVVPAVVVSVGAQKADAVWQKVAAPNARGYVLLLRHAIAPGGGDPENFRLGDCTTQRNVSDDGRAQARKIGAWLSAQNVKIAGVESSRWCRATETAELLNLGKPRANPSLDSLFLVPNADTHPKTQRARKQIANHRNKPGLLVLVGHQANIIALTGVAPASGEGILVKARPNGKLQVLGRSPAPAM